MLSNFVIGLREGFEAALIIGILVAYLHRSGRSELIRPMWFGVGAAVAASAALGAFLTFSSVHMSARGEEIFTGIISLVAVGFVTWMVFWMKSAARGIKGELHGRLDAAVVGGAWAVAVVGFIAVAREGLETALFLWSASSASGSATALIGAFFGLAVAAVLGVLVYRGALRLNMAAFFKVTGIALIVVAAGVLAYAVHEFQEAGWLPGEDNLAFSLPISEDSPLATVVAGLVNLTPSMSVLQVAAWFAYLVPTVWLFLRTSRPAVTAGSPAAGAAASAAPAADQGVTATNSASHSAGTAAVGSAAAQSRS